MVLYAFVMPAYSCVGYRNIVCVLVIGILLRMLIQCTGHFTYYHQHRNQPFLPLVSVNLALSSHSVNPLTRPLSSRSLNNSFITLGLTFVRASSHFVGQVCMNLVIRVRFVTQILLHTKVTTFRLNFRRVKNIHSDVTILQDIIQSQIE